MAIKQKPPFWGNGGGQCLVRVGGKDIGNSFYNIFP